MTNTQEARLFRNGFFLYQGYHFKPVRQFAQKDGDFFSITRKLKVDVELGMMDGDYHWEQKHPYSYKSFYEASTDKEADIFLCFENQKQYVPGEHFLGEYIADLESDVEDRKPVHYEPGFTQDELELLSDGMLALIHNANIAKTFITDSDAYTAINAKVNKCVSLNNKICGSMTSE